jgi:hypothetical protein
MRDPLVHFAVPHFNLRGHSCEFPWSCFPAPCKRGHSCNFACLFSVHIPWNRDSESLTRRKSVLSQNLKVDLLVVINLVINIHGSVPLADLSDSYPANSLRSVVLASGKSPVLYVWSRSDEDRRPRVGGRYPLSSSLAGLKVLSIPLHCLSNMNLQLNLPLVLWQVTTREIRRVLPSNALAKRHLRDYLADLCVKSRLLTSRMSSAGGTIGTLL